MSPPLLRRLLPTAALAVFAVIVLRSAWMCDDAFITLRTIDNFTAGHGLTWNVAERVQAYTHPLWMILLTVFYAATREPFVTTIILGLLVTILATAVVAFKSTRALTGALIAIGILSVSKAFVDYSTSGLENPLTHFLLVLFILALIDGELDDRRMFRLSLLGALCMTNRMDCALIVAPALVWAFRQSRGARRLRAIVLGFTPFIVWEVFSLIYYGFPFPNTAYAKLNTGISKLHLVKQGVYYLENSFRLDPITLPVIAAGIAVPFVTRNRRHGVIAVGIAAYLLYVVSVGGDFMSGRLLTAPFLCAVVLIARYPFAKAKAWVPVATAIILIGILVPTSPWRSGPGYGSERDGLVDGNGVADERGYYFQEFGLFRDDGKRGVGYYKEAIRGREAAAAPVVMGGNIGVFGYYAGPGVYVIDGFALADPLLARLPARSTNWRIGHFVRDVPAGYAESLAGDKNLIRDARIHDFYEPLSVITRAPLFAPARLGAILRMNTGGYRGLTASLFESYAHHQRGTAAAAAGDRDDAVNELNQAVTLDSTRANAWVDLYRVHHQYGELDSAERALFKAIQLRPSEFEDELLVLSDSYRTRGMNERARSLTEWVFSAHLQLAAWYQTQGVVADAIKEYEKALRIYPDNPEARARLDALRAR